MSFHVTTEHIDSWYKFNQYWADDLNDLEKIRLCRLFYTYQVYQKQFVDPEVIIQTQPERLELARYLARKLIKVEYCSDLLPMIGDDVDPRNLPPNVNSSDLQPFFLQTEDIKMMVTAATPRVELSVIDNITDIKEKYHYILFRNYYASLIPYISGLDDQQIQYIIKMHSPKEILLKQLKDDLNISEPERIELKKVFLDFMKTRLRIAVDNKLWGKMKEMMGIVKENLANRMSNYFLGYNITDELGYYNKIDAPSYILPSNYFDELLAILRKVIIWNKIKNFPEVTPKPVDDKIKRVENIYNVRIAIGYELFDLMDIFHEVKEEDLDKDNNKFTLLNKYVNEVDLLLEEIHSNFIQRDINKDEIRKELSILYGYCLAIVYGKTADVYFFEYLKKKKWIRENNIIYIRPIIIHKPPLPIVSDLNVDVSKNVKDFIIDNMYDYYIDKDLSVMPFIVKIYYRIVYSGEALYYGKNQSFPPYDFIVKNLNDRKVENPYLQIVPSYRFINKIKDKKTYETNLTQFFEKLKEVKDDLVENLKTKIFTYKTTAPTSGPEKLGTIEINMFDVGYFKDTVSLSKENFKTNWQTYREQGVFSAVVRRALGDNQLEYFYDYLKSDIIYGTKFTHNTDNDIYLDKSVLETPPTPFNFLNMKKYLTGELIFDVVEGNLLQNNNIVIDKATIMINVKKIKNWTEMNAFQGMDGEGRKEEDGGREDGGREDGTSDGGVKLRQSIYNVISKLDSNMKLAKEKLIPTNENLMDYYVNFYNDTHNLTKEQKNSGKEEMLKDLEKLPLVKSAYEVWSKEYPYHLLEYEPNIPEVTVTDINSKVYDKKAVGNVLKSAGLILFSDDVNAYLKSLRINSCDISVSKDKENVIISSSSSSYFTSSCPYNYKLQIKEFAASIISNCSEKEYVEWKDKDFQDFEKNLLNTSIIIDGKQKLDIIIGFGTKVISSLALLMLFLFLMFSEENRNSAYNTLVNIPTNIMHLVEYKDKADMPLVEYTGKDYDDKEYIDIAKLYLDKKKIDLLVSLKFNNGLLESLDILVPIYAILKVRQEMTYLPFAYYTYSESGYLKNLKDFPLIRQMDISKSYSLLKKYGYIDEKTNLLKEFFKPDTFDMEDLLKKLKKKFTENENIFNPQYQDFVNNLFEVIINDIITKNENINKNIANGDLWLKNKQIEKNAWLKNKIQEKIKPISPSTTISRTYITEKITLEDQLNALNNYFSTSDYDLSEKSYWSSWSIEDIEKYILIFLGESEDSLKTSTSFSSSSPTYLSFMETQIQQNSIERMIDYRFINKIFLNIKSYYDKGYKLFEDLNTFDESSGKSLSIYFPRFISQNSCDTDDPKNCYEIYKAINEARPDSKVSKVEELLDGRKSSYDKKSRITKRKSPSTSRKSPFTSRKSPFTSRKSPFTSRKSPFTSRKSPFTSRKSPFTSRKSPFTRRKSPFTRRKSPSTSRKSRKSPLNCKRSPLNRKKNKKSRSRDGSQLFVVTPITPFNTCKVFKAL